MMHAVEPIIATAEDPDAWTRLADVLLLPASQGPTVPRFRPAFAHWPGLSLAAVGDLHGTLHAAVRDGLLIVLPPTAAPLVTVLRRVYWWWATGGESPLLGAVVAAQPIRRGADCVIGSWNIDTVAGEAGDPASDLGSA